MMARWRRNDDDRAGVDEALRDLSEMYARVATSSVRPGWWKERAYGPWPGEKIAARLRAERRDG